MDVRYVQRLLGHRTNSDGHNPHHVKHALKVRLQKCQARRAILAEPAS